MARKLRTSVVGSKKLRRDALLAATGLTKRAVLARQAEIRALRGKRAWSGDLAAMRRDA